MEFLGGGLEGIIGKRGEEGEIRLRFLEGGKELDGHVAAVVGGFHRRAFFSLRRHSRRAVFFLLPPGNRRYG